MAKFGDLTLDVNINISEETVKRCTELLSMYLTDNPHLDISVFEFHDKTGISRQVSVVIRDEQ